MNKKTVKKSNKKSNTLNYVVICIVSCLIGLLIGVNVDNNNEKQCVKWKTVTTGGRDCSGLTGYEYIYCKNFQEKQTSTQECVEWAE